MSIRSRRDSFSSETWHRLLKNRGAVIALTIIALGIVSGIFAYFLAPDSSPGANHMMLEISGEKPGFRMQMLALRKYPAVEKVGFWQHLLYGQPSRFAEIPITGYTFRDDSLDVQQFIDEGNIVLEKFDLLHIAYSLPAHIQTRKANDTLWFNDGSGWKRTFLPELRKKVQEQIYRRTFWLGTDKYGRDILSRIIVGVRVSLGVGLIAVCVSLSIGIFLGALAGYFRGWIDEAVMWLINVLWSIPTLLLVFALTIALGKGFWQIFLAVGLTMWVSVARIIRGQVLSIREADFIEATRALGYGQGRIIVRHILPNILGPVLVVAANNFATAIVVEAGLSFLGIGIQPPTPSWGLMLQENYGFIITHNPFLAIAPGLAIMLMVLAFNLLGNGLRDAMDVKGRL